MVTDGPPRVPSSATAEDGTRASTFAAVLAAASQGRPEAFSHLWTEYAPPVRAFVTRLGCAEPDETVNDVFAQVFARIDRFRGDEPGFRGLLFTVARRRVVDARRRRGREVSTVPLEAMFDDERGPSQEGPAKVEQLDAVRALLGCLTDDQRHVVLLRVIADLDIGQTAAVMGRRPGAVKALQARALARLRECATEGER